MSWNLLGLGVVLLATLGVPVPVGPADRGVASASSTNGLAVGLTFSPREATYRELSWQHTFDAALDAAPALVRVGVYWNEIEATRGLYDFATLDWLLDQATARNQHILLTVGMKAPRWPEYYLPGWLRAAPRLPDGADVSRDSVLRAATRAVLTATVEHVRERRVIAAWQVENEPLDAAGPHEWRIGPEFLAEEVALVRELDNRHRPVVVNTFVETGPLGLLPTARATMLERAQQALAVADVLGLDVYPSRAVGLLWAETTVTWPDWIWSDTLVRLRRLATAQSKDAWIVEAQAEPWLSAGQTPPAAWPGAGVRPSSVANTLDSFSAAGYQIVLLWGTEYWEAQRSQNADASWWSSITGLFATSARPTLA